MPVIDLGSVVGPAGATGATGATGPQGIQGNPGPNQVTANTSTTLDGILMGNGNNVATATVDSSPSTSHASNLISSAAVADAINAAGNFAAPTTIADETDLNTITDSGCYRCSAASRARTIVNAPWAVNSDQGEAFVLFVVKNNANNSTYFIQQLITPSVVYTRRHYDSTWSDWTSMREKVESDLASITLWGSTNATGSTIAKGTYFYRKGELVHAIADIANNATLTENTNYSKITKGILNELIQPKGLYRDALALTSGTASTYTFTTDTAFLLVVVRYSSSGSSYSGIWFGTAATSSFVTAIVSTTHATVTVSGRTLSITADSAYMYAYIIPLNSGALA